MPSLPNARELFDGDTDPGAQAERGGATRKNVKSDRDVRDIREEFLAEMTKATIAGLNGESTFSQVGTPGDTAVGRVTNPYGETRMVPPIVTDHARRDIVRKAMDEFDMAKSAGSADFEGMAKEWTLTNPNSTGLV